ncbi:MAG: protein translocase subunit SecDF, partial [Chloroflexia bacterium]|nr:protein translocase subunit SecDF [Chloroflexia bacterium]
MNKTLLKHAFIVFTGILMFQNCSWQHKSTSELLKQEGGIIFTLKVGNEDILRSLASNPQDSIFKTALYKAIEAQKKDNENDFITLFADAFYETAPNGNFASLFINSHLQQINYNSSKEDVIKALKSERDDAIENICKVLSFRIGDIGIRNANVQKLDDLGLILVELPGIKEPGRVRKLLANTGNLEFWETYDNIEVFEFLRLANSKLK